MALAGGTRILAACGWPGADASADVIEYVLTLRLIGDEARLEEYVGTDQGEALLTERVLTLAVPRDVDRWITKAEQWFADAVTLNRIVRAIGSALRTAAHP